MRRCTSRAPGLAHHAHDLARGGAAHDRVVDQHDAPALEHVAHRVELDADAHRAQALARLDEGAADVVVADQAPLEGQPALPREAERRAHPAVGHRADDVGVGRLLARELAAEREPRLEHRAAEDQAVRAREVDVLEHAVRGRLGRERLERADARARRPPAPRRARRRARTRPRSGRARRSRTRAPWRCRACPAPAAGSPRGRGRRPAPRASGTAARRRPSPCRGSRRSRPRAAPGGCARRDAGSPRCRRWTGRSSPPPRAPGAGSRRS